MRTAAFLAAAALGVVNAQPDDSGMAELRSANPNAFAIVQALLIKQKMGLGLAAKHASVETSVATESSTAVEEMPRRHSHHNWLNWRPAEDHSDMVAKVMQDVGGRAPMSLVAHHQKQEDDLVSPWHASAAPAPVAKKVSLSSSFTWGSYTSASNLPTHEVSTASNPLLADEAAMNTAPVVKSTHSEPSLSWGNIYSEKPAASVSSATAVAETFSFPMPAIPAAPVAKVEAEPEATHVHMHHSSPAIDVVTRMSAPAPPAAGGSDLAELRRSDPASFAIVEQLLAKKDAGLPLSKREVDESNGSASQGAEELRAMAAQSSTAALISHTRHTSSVAESSKWLNWKPAESAVDVPTTALVAQKMTVSRAEVRDDVDSSADQLVLHPESIVPEVPVVAAQPAQWDQFLAKKAPVAPVAQQQVQSVTNHYLLDLA